MVQTLGRVVDDCWGSGVDDARRRTLCPLELALVETFRSSRTHLLDGIANVLLVRDVSDKEWHVKVPLNNVEHRDTITTSNQSLDYVSSQEATTANDEIRVDHSCRLRGSEKEVCWLFELKVPKSTQLMSPDLPKRGIPGLSV